MMKVKWKTCVVVVVVVEVVCILPDNEHHRDKSYHPHLHMPLMNNGRHRPPCFHPN